MEKVIRDGLVAVLYSPGFGAGWFTWNSGHQELIFDPQLVDMVEKGKRDEITEEWIEENLGLNDVFVGGASDLEIKWLPVGTNFGINEYDGSESIKTVSDLFLTA